MDNFMDRLSKRFNAGEMIQANAEAEARESERMKRQIDEYEKMMQEIRRLNLKTAEMSEQVSQLLASGIEQFESYERERAQTVLRLQDEDTEGEKKEEIIAALSEKIGGLQSNLAALAQCLQNSIRTNEGMANQIAACNDRIVRMQQTLEMESANHTPDQQDNLEEVSRMLLTQQNAIMDGVENRTAGISLRIDNSEVSVKREISDAAYRMEASVSELRQCFMEQLSPDAGREDEEFARKVVDTLQQLAKAQEESSKQLKEMIVNLRLYMDEVQKHIEDYVHKEDVKVYRNVQASFSEQMTNRFRGVADQLGSLDKRADKNKGTRGLLIVTFLMAAASAALQVAQILGIL